MIAHSLQKQPEICRGALLKYLSGNTVRFNSRLSILRSIRLGRGIALKSGGSRESGIGPGSDFLVPQCEFGMMAS